MQESTHQDPWPLIRQQAKTILEQEPALSPLMLSAIINRHSLVSALAHRLAHRLAAPDLPATPLLALFDEALVKAPDISQSIHCDMHAIVSRDAAVGQLIDVLLYMKGFHALTTHRLAHLLWKNGRKHMARYIQSRASEVFQTDIHPAAVIGDGIFIDHATGVVIGETSVIGNNVTLLHDVTLGGTGKTAGLRHPCVEDGVLVGAGAQVLGRITIGRNARVGAGAVVLHSVDPGMTVAGIPARPVGDIQHPHRTELPQCGR